MPVQLRAGHLVEDVWPLRRALWFALLLSVAPSRAAAETLTIALPAVRDNTVFDASPPTLSNGAGAYMFVGKNANGQERRALLRFDLSAIPRGASVQAARLQLSMTQTTDASGVLVHVRALSSDWGEGSSNSGGTATGGGGSGATASVGDATWLRRFYDTVSWTTPGGDFAAADSATLSILAEGTYTFSGPGLADDVRSWLATPGNNFGWILLTDAAAPRTAKRFNTRENVDLASRPLLMVDYVPAATPVPVPWWSAALIALGLFASANWARRRYRV